jgi:hypothetical protein
VNYQYLGFPPSVGFLLPPVDEVSHVSCLQLRLKNHQDCRNAGLLLERMHSVTSLFLRLMAPCLDGTMGDACETGQQVINTLFGPFIWYDPARCRTAQRSEASARAPMHPRRSSVREFISAQLDYRVIL